MFRLLLPKDNSLLIADKRTFSDIVGKPVPWEPDSYAPIWSKYLEQANGSWLTPYEWHTFLEIEGSSHVYGSTDTMFKVDTNDAADDVSRYQVAVMMKLKAGVTYFLGNCWLSSPSSDMRYNLYLRDGTTEANFKGMTNFVYDDHGRGSDADSSRTTYNSMNFGETRQVTPTADTIYIAGVCTYSGSRTEIVTLCDPPPERMTKKEITNNVYIQE